MTSITRKIDDTIQEYGSWEKFESPFNKDKMEQIQLEVGSRLSPTRKLVKTMICTDDGWRWVYLYATPLQVTVQTTKQE